MAFFSKDNLKFQKNLREALQNACFFPMAIKFLIFDGSGRNFPSERSYQGITNYFPP